MGALKWFAAVVVVAGFAGAMSARAAEPGSLQVPAGLEERREWLKERLPRLTQNPQQQREIVASLDRMSPEQIDALVETYVGRVRALQEQAEAELARAQAARDALERELAARRAGAPGFAPVITTLPTGASLTAGAVVSPDRRFVRINATPFFSSVGPVQTFGYGPGYYPYGYHPHYHGHPVIPQPVPVVPPAPPTGFPPGFPPLGAYAYGTQPMATPSAVPDRIWHDGLRTRVGPRP